MNQRIFDQLDQLQRGAREPRLHGAMYDDSYAQRGYYYDDETAHARDVAYDKDDAYPRGTWGDRYLENPLEQYYDNTSAVNVSDQARYYDRRTHMEPRMLPPQPNYLQHQSQRPQAHETRLGSQFDLCKQ